MNVSVFSSRLNEVMKRKQLKQVELIRLAEERGITLGKSQVSQYVSGKTLPRRKVLAVLAQVLGVEESWLCGEEAPTEVIIHKQTGQEIAKEEAEKRGSSLREFNKSTKLDNVLYDVRGPVVDEALRMEKTGTHILKLNIGNPAPFGFRTPDEIIYDMSQQLTECEGYSDSKGLFSARKAIMQYAQIKNIPNVSIDDIYTGNGVSELINLCMSALLDDGDEVLFSAPTYGAFADMAYLNGGVPVSVPVTEEQKFNLPAMKEKIGEKTKIVVICNPNNPTGTYVPIGELEAFADTLPEDVLLVMDEAYMEFATEPDCCSMVDYMKAHLEKPILVLRTFSKYYAMAGLRVGYALGSEELIGIMRKCSASWNLNVCAQKAAE